MQKPVVVLAFVCCTLVSCADGECVPFEGKEYNWNVVSEVVPGTTVDELRSKIGEPVAITSVAPGVQDWRFFYRCKRTSWLVVGGAKIRSGGATLHSEAIIRIKSGRVDRILKNTGWVFE